MSKYVVTGCAGFIGAHLTKRLLELGHEVIGIDDFSTVNKDEVDSELLSKVDFHLIDLGSTASFVNDVYKQTISTVDAIRNAIRGSDGVFHLAAKARVQPSFQNPTMYNRTNVSGLLNLLEACRLEGIVKFIFSSSSSVYGDKDGRAFRETDNLKPNSPYAFQKVIGEEHCNFYNKTFGFQCTSLRYFNVYGSGMKLSGQYAQAIPIFLNQFKNGEPFTVFGDGEQRRDCTYVGDVVEANILAMACERTLASAFGLPVYYNIGSGVNYSVNEICEMIGGKEYPKVHLPEKKEPKSTLANCDQAKLYLSWQPKTTLPDWISHIKPIIKKD